MDTDENERWMFIAIKKCNQTNVEIAHLSEM
jgi:hypothetical protein